MYADVVELKNAEARVNGSAAYDEAVIAFVRQTGGAPSVIDSLLRQGEIRFLSELGSEAVRLIFNLAYGSPQRGRPELWWKSLLEDWETAKANVGSTPVKKWDAMRLVNLGFLPTASIVEEGP